MKKKYSNGLSKRTKIISLFAIMVCLVPYISPYVILWDATTDGGLIINVSAQDTDTTSQTAATGRNLILTLLPPESEDP